MRRPTVVLMGTLLAAAAQGCVGASTPGESTGVRHDPRVAASCPVVASACAAGCFAVGLQPVDVARACVLPSQTVGCSPFNLVGPPAVVCSVTADGTPWISLEARQHPAGRACTSDEIDRFLRLPSCSATR